jgi:predicted alpha/beta hydrolase family esterase
MTSHLIVPGLGSSGADHWQTWLEGRLPRVSRIRQDDWSTPHLAAWSARIRYHLQQSIDRAIIIAHSFGALAAVQAAADHQDKVAGLLLVAPADPAHFGLDDSVVALETAIPTIVVASTTDPWITPARARHFAAAWHGELLDIGAAGHINAKAGFGPWPAVLPLIARLERQSNAPIRSRGAAAQPSTKRLADAASLLRSAGWDVRQRNRFVA